MHSLKILLIAACAAIASTASAIPISDELSVFFTDPAGGSPVLNRQMTVFEDGSFTTVGAGNCVLFGGTPCGGVENLNFYFLPDLSVNPGSAVVLQEGNTISDIVFAYQFALWFISDGEGDPSLSGVLDLLINSSVIDSTAITIVEENGLLDVSGLLSDDYRRLGFSATFVSDPDSVPEPGTLALLALGLLGAGRARRDARAPK